MLPATNPLSPNPVPDRPTVTQPVHSLLAEGKHDEALKTATAVLAAARQTGEGDARICQALQAWGMCSVR